MKRPDCGIEVKRIGLSSGGTLCCGADMVTYWEPTKEPISEIITPNGERLYGTLVGDLKDAVGIGYVPHTCLAGKHKCGYKYAVFRPHVYPHEKNELLMNVDGSVRIFYSIKEAHEYYESSPLYQNSPKIRVGSLKYLRSMGICKRCGSPLFRSLTPGYRYQCFTCDEDFYEIEQ